MHGVLSGSLENESMKVCDPRETTRRFYLQVGCEDPSVSS